MPMTWYPSSSVSQPLSADSTIGAYCKYIVPIDIQSSVNGAPIPINDRCSRIGLGSKGWNMAGPNIFNFFCLLPIGIF